MDIDYNSMNRYLRILLETATCEKRAVAAVLVLRGGEWIGGSNGPPDSSIDYCRPCPRRESESGMDMDICPAIHAEVAAVLNSHRSVEGSTLYITCGIPCKDCMKELIVVGVKRIVSSYPLSTYVNREDGFDDGETYNFSLAYMLMEDAGMEYIHDERILRGSTAHVGEQ